MLTLYKEYVTLTGTVPFSNSVERPPILIKSLANGA